MFKSMIKKLLILSIFSISLLFTSCDLPTNFTAPQWDADLNVPITEKNYVLGDIVKTNRNLLIDSSLGKGKWLYKVLSDNYVQNFQIGDFLQDQLNASYDNLEFFVATVDTTALVDIQSGASIDSAYITEGLLEIIIDSKATSDVNFNLKLPGFTDANGNARETGGVVPANSQRTFTAVLDNSGYSSRNQVSASQLMLSLKMNGTTPGQPLNIKINIKNTKFYLVSGAIPTKTLNPIVKSVSLPLTKDVENFRDKFTLNKAALNLNADYISRFQKDAFDVIMKDVKVIGKRVSGGTKNLTTLAGSTNFGDFTIRDGKFFRKFDGSNSNIAEFLSFLPDSITLESGVIVNPNTEKGTATVDDTIRITVAVEAQSYIDLDNLTTNDTLALDIDEDIRKEIRNGKFARLIYEITNYIPINTDFAIDFRKSNYDTLFTKTATADGGKFISEFAVQPSGPNPSKKIELTGEEILKLADANIVILKTVAKTTQATGSAMNYVGPDMQMKIKAYAQIKYHINLDK